MKYYFNKTRLYNDIEGFEYRIRNEYTVLLTSFLTYSMDLSTFFSVSAAY